MDSPAVAPDCPSCQASIGEQIEALLLRRKGWVSGDEIAAELGIDKRDWRAKGSRKGMISRFAISNSSRGLKHLRYVSEAEFDEYSSQRRRHAATELVTLRETRKNWMNARQFVQGMLF